MYLRGISRYRELRTLNKHAKTQTTIVKKLLIFRCTGEEGDVVKDKQVKEKGNNFHKDEEVYRVKFTIHVVT